MNTKLLFFHFYADVDISQFYILIDLTNDKINRNSQLIHNNFFKEVQNEKELHQLQNGVGLDS